MRKLSIIKSANIFLALACLLSAAENSGGQKHSWQYYFEKGMIEYRGEMYEYAILNLGRCLEVNPQCFEAANVLAEIYVKKNQREKSIEYYGRSLAINDRQADVHNAIAELHEYFVETARAMEHYLRAVEIEPGHIKANCSLVRFYLKKGDRAAADRHFRASYAAATAAYGPALAEARAEAKAGRAAKAVKSYRRLLDDAPSLLEAYLELAELHLRRNENASAAAVLERLIVMRPDHEKAHVLLGDVYLTRRLPGRRWFHLEMALKNFKAALELNPDNFEACYSVSDAYREWKKDIEARAWFDKCMAIEERVEGKKLR